MAGVHRRPVEHAGVHRLLQGCLNDAEDTDCGRAAVIDRRIAHRRGVAQPSHSAAGHSFQLPFSLTNDCVSVSDSPGCLDLVVVVTSAVAAMCNPRRLVNATWRITAAAEPQSTWR